MNLEQRITERLKTLKADRNNLLLQREEYYSIVPQLHLRRVRGTNAALDRVEAAMRELMALLKDNDAAHRNSDERHSAPPRSHEDDAAAVGAAGERT